ncbi:hypothetical protein RZS08_36785, partial [Arthrospira platensis SPKY1]|nr:hypothetical protein [Arthrospira platensis SPKY1]
MHTGTVVTPNTNYITVDIPQNDVFFRKEVWYDQGALLQFAVVVFKESETGALNSVAATTWLNVGSSNTATERGFRLADPETNEPLGFVWYDATNTVDPNNG